MEKNGSRLLDNKKRISLVTYLITLIIMLAIIIGLVYVIVKGKISWKKLYRILEFNPIVMPKIYLSMWQ